MPPHASRHTTVPRRYQTTARTHIFALIGVQVVRLEGEFHFRQVAVSCRFDKSFFVLLSTPMVVKRRPCHVTSTGQSGQR